MSKRTIKPFDRRLSRPEPIAINPRLQIQTTLVVAHSIQFSQINCQIPKDLVRPVVGEIRQQRRHIARAVLEDEVADSWQNVGDRSIWIPTGI